MVLSPFTPDEDPSHIVPAGNSFIATLVRSMGLTEQHASDVMGIKGLTPAHGLMGRDPVPAGVISHLQPIMNRLAYAAHRVMDSRGVEEREVATAMTLARWVVWQAPYCDSVEAVRALIDEAREELEQAVLDYDYINTIEAYAADVPQVHQDEMKDPGTVEALLARFCGLSRSQLVEWGVPRSTAGYMLNGREDWFNEHIDTLALHVCAFGQHLRRANLGLHDDDAELPLDSIVAIRAFNQAQAATMWLQWPMYRPFLERYSQHVFSTDRDVGRRVRAEGGEV